jgi:hypothetical protein
MYNQRKKQVFDWAIQTEGNEIIILEGEEIGRAIVLDQMNVAAKVAFVDDVVRVNTIVGYTAIINFEDKTIIIEKE